MSLWSTVRGLFGDNPSYVVVWREQSSVGTVMRGEPINARPVGNAERAWRWCRRNPVVAGLTAAVVASLLAGVVISAHFGIQADNRAKDALRERDRADAKAIEAATEKGRADQKAVEAEASAASTAPNTTSRSTLFSREMASTSINSSRFILYRLRLLGSPRAPRQARPREPARTAGL